jgi:hypothetical protein
MSENPTEPQGPSSTATLVAGMVALVVTIAAYIACELTHISSAPVIAVAGPVIAALLLRDGIQRVERKADQAVKNTNGALTGGIEEAMRRVYRQEREAEQRQLVAVKPSEDGAPVTVELVPTPPSAATSSTAT